MTASETSGRGVAFVARFLVTTVASALLGLVVALVEPESEPGAVPMVLGMVVFGWFVVGIYELAVWGVAELLRPVARRLFPARPGRPTVFTPTRSALVLGSYFGLTAVVAAILSAVLVMASGGVVQSTPTPAQLAWILPVSLGLGAVGSWLVFRRRATRRDRVTLRRWMRRREDQAVQGAVLGGLLFAAVVTWVFPRFLPVAERYEPGAVARVASTGGWGQLAMVLFVVTVAPVVEEFLFRGVFLEGMRRRFGRHLSVAVTTGLFGLAHVTEIVGHWPATVAILIAGWALAELRLRTGSLRPPMAAHAAYNATLVLIAFNTV